MNWKQFNPGTTKLYKMLFLVVFWTMWMIFPFLMSLDKGMMDYMYKMIPVNLTMVPLFFINTELLVGKLLPKKGMAYYVSVLIPYIIVAFLIHLFLKNMLGDKGGFSTVAMFRSFFPVLTITAVSTGYGLINYFVTQQRIEEEKSAQRKQSELSFLRSQISPHFIFNALNSIVYLIRTKSSKAEEVTLKLSEIMQYMTYNTRDAMVPLDKELSYLENYIDLQEMRFGEDVDIKYQRSGDSEGKMIEPMLIIPFVENAFKHGTGTVMDPQILIDITSKGDDVVINVKNKFVENQNTGSQHAGIGYENVKRRLDLLYPNKHILTIIAEDGWYIIHLEITLHN